MNWTDFQVLKRIPSDSKSWLSFSSNLFMDWKDFQALKRIPVE